MFICHRVLGTGRYGLHQRQVASFYFFYLPFSTFSCFYLPPFFLLLFLLKINWLSFDIGGHVSKIAIGILFILTYWMNGHIVLILSADWLKKIFPIWKSSLESIFTWLNIYAFNNFKNMIYRNNLTNFKQSEKNVK